MLFLQVHMRMGYSKKICLIILFLWSLFSFGQHINSAKLSLDSNITLLKDILIKLNKKQIELSDPTLNLEERINHIEDSVKIIKHKMLELNGSVDRQGKKIKTQSNVTILYFVVALIALVVVVVLFSTIKEKKLINKQLQQQHVLVRESAENLKEKNKEITDSIKYARRIQEAMLPSKIEIKNILPNSFVYYRPKDIVSGDFYWVGEKNGKVFVVTADCTGHGVPGALMSMLGIANLNEIINEKQIFSPAKILDELRNVIINSLTKTEGDAMKDGMDLSLYCYDKRLKRITYAAANNGIYVVRDGTIIILNPDKQPVGESPTKDRPFSEGTFDLKSNDMILTFTDGFADQFGGPKGKKYKYKQLQELILELQKRPVYHMSELLNQAFMRWKGKLEQVDDVLLIGVKV